MVLSWWRKKPCYQLQMGPYHLQIAPEQTLLQAAKAYGVDIPQGCTVGCCGLCRCQLLSGQIDAPSAAELTRLTAAELSQGVFLACQHKITADSVVTILAAAQSQQPGQNFSVSVVEDSNRIRAK